jgi:hypothetical protein
MNYTKPQVAVLGQASVVIAQHEKAIPGIFDGVLPVPYLNPAYDLDE